MAKNDIRTACAQNQRDVPGEALRYQLVKPLCFLNPVFEVKQERSAYTELNPAHYGHSRKNKYAYSAYSEYAAGISAPYVHKLAQTPNKPFFVLTYARFVLASFASQNSESRLRLYLKKIASRRVRPQANPVGVRVATLANLQSNSSPRSSVASRVALRYPVCEQTDPGPQNLSDPRWRIAEFCGLFRF